jgi:hypothetical protein
VGEWNATKGATFPNDCVALYGSAAKYRLRMYTSGGFSPDGVRSCYPTEYSRYFRLHVRLDGGEVSPLTPDPRAR